MGKDTELEINCGYQNKLHTYFFKNVKYHLLFRNLFLKTGLNLLNQQILKP
jgi:hypothetical protein